MNIKNTRVLAYLKATGKIEKEFKDRPWEYNIWCTDKWVEFAKEINVSWEKVGRYQNEFDEWLKNNAE